MAESGARLPFGHHGAPQSLQEISNSPMKLDYIVEDFMNFIMIALEGQKFIKLKPDY